MRAIERVMEAYRRTHNLTEEQAGMVREELSRFIDEMIAGRLPQSPKSNNPQRVVTGGHRKADAGAAWRDFGRVSAIEHFPHHRRQLLVR